MPFESLKNGKVYYKGNKINEGYEIKLNQFEEKYCTDRIDKIHNEKKFYHLSKIDDGIMKATMSYFSSNGSHWCNLPLTTLMISSPGEVYAGQTLDYTTDALPVEIPSRFGNNRRIFLSESSQFYLELHLLIQGVESVYSVYNSFRKEKTDATHLSEFQHIEYEGKTDLSGCKSVFLNLFNAIFNHLYENNKESLLYFLDDEKLEQKKTLVEEGPITIDFKDAMEKLYKDTKNEKYKEFSLEYFGSREEIRLTELLGGNVIVEKFPMLQIPFYHNFAQEKYGGVPLAKNADFILHGYRETIGAGERITDKKTLLKKAEIFNLPKEDYLPYTSSRDYVNYTTTSGFGLGWQRLVHWLTDQPTIYEATIFPRTHFIPNP